MTDYKIKYQGRVTDSGLYIIHRKAFDQDVQVWNGKDVTVTVERKKRSRSVEQNAYYWGVVVPMAQSGLNDTGYRADKLTTHTLLKTLFLKQEIVNEQTGEILNAVGSTSKLSTVQFMEFIADVQRWAAEFLSIEIPDPGEQVKIEFV